MSPTAAAASKGGVVVLGGVEVLFAVKLSVERENALRRELAAVARDQLGPGGFFGRMAPTLRWLREGGYVAEWKEAVDELTRLQGTGADPAPEAIDDARQTAKGAAAELWHRTREYHPDKTREQIAAVVTDANAFEVYSQIVRAVTDAGKAPAPSASPA